MSTPSRNNREERSSPESPKHNRNIASSSSPSVAYNFSAPPPPMILPPGYKFLPSDEVVILHYLKPFSQGTINSFPDVHRVNIYESDPEQLSREYKKGNATEWFFITERTKKSEGGKHQNRRGNGGWWRPMLSGKKIEAGDGVVGYRTSLKYDIGRESNRVKGDWLMHEYWFDSNGDDKKVDYALCKIYLTPKEAKLRTESLVRFDLNSWKQTTPELRSVALIIPPGYKFAPTDDDLFSHYLIPFLKRKRNSFPNVPIHRANIYKSTPEQLSKEYEKGNDREWFFVTERTKRSEGGKHIIRNDSGGGWWKNILLLAEFEAGHGVVCYKYSLNYHTAPEKGDWLMQEYSCNSYGQKDKVDHALCKLYLVPKEAKRRAEEEEKVDKPILNFDLNVANEEEAEEKVDKPLLDFDLNVAYEEEEEVDHAV